MTRYYFSAESGAESGGIWGHNTEFDLGSFS